VSNPVSIVAAGMVTAVGNTGAASAAAMRAGVRGVAQGKLWDYSAGDYLGVGRPTLAQWWEGRDMLAELVAPAIDECLTAADQMLRLPPPMVPVILIVAPPDRPCRWPDLNQNVLDDVGHKLGHRLPTGSLLISEGRSGIVRALEQAALLFEHNNEACVIAGVESFLRMCIADHYQLKERRLLTQDNSNGLTLGEAGAAVLVTPRQRHRGPQLTVVGTGRAHDPSGAGGNDKHPAKATGLTQAIRQALAGARINYRAIDLRISDANGEHWKFKEVAFVGARLDRPRPAGSPPRPLGLMDHWHPSEFIGDVGAAIGPVMLGWALHAGQKRYLHGPRVLIHASEDNGDRAALIAEFYTPGSASSSRSGSNGRRANT
jgi:3-oxoacyl-[acyl-carrier-protein] synthase-1